MEFFFLAMFVLSMSLKSIVHPIQSPVDRSSTYVMMTRCIPPRYKWVYSNTVALTVRSFYGSGSQIYRLCDKQRLKTTSKSAKHRIDARIGEQAPDAEVYSNTGLFPQRSNHRARIFTSDYIIDFLCAQEEGKTGHLGPVFGQTT